MTSEKFSNLYQKEGTDDIIPIIKDIGFTLVKDYPEGSIFKKDGNRMFIRLAILNENEIFYSIDMVRPKVISEKEARAIGGKEGDVEYPITDISKYKNKITTFFYNPNTKDRENIIFNESEGKIIYKFKNGDKKFTLNEFVDILIKNHLADRLKFKKKINLLIDKLLKFTFWLAHEKYDQVEIFLFRYEILKEGKFYEPKEKTPDPFFNYFKLYKHILFVESVILVILLMVYKFFCINLFKNVSLGEFSISNPIIILLVFAFLFISELFSELLEKSIKDFFSDKNPKNKNFIKSLDNYLRKNNFKLKLK
ncbi:MAG: hypothetical protein PHQ01_03525 [Candidatus Pacebacteria bacterium]|nr:hypothetical protein [Candidatus Paceibacterota bacterium]